MCRLVCHDVYSGDRRPASGQHPNHREWADVSPGFRFRVWQRSKAVPFAVSSDQRDGGGYRR